MASIAPKLTRMYETSMVSTATERDIHYWCNRLKVSRVVLSDIVANVGTRTCEIERFLKYWDS